MDRVLRQVCAVIHGAYSPKQLAILMAALGAWFDYALLNWENDSLGLGVTEELIEHPAYTNLYKCEPDRLDLGAYGWNTNTESRKLMTARGKTHFEHTVRPVLNPYIPFYGEAANFQVPPGSVSKKPQAITGHDDTVMSYCGLVMTDLSMPDPVPPSRQHTMKPGEVSAAGLANIKSTSGYRAAAQRRAAATRNT
jgi:hypothetical protein